MIYDYIIDLGIEDFITKNNINEIHCDKNEIYSIKKELETKIKNFISTKIEWIPNNFITLSDNEKKIFIDFLEILEDDDDVQNVYTNLKN